MNAGEDFVDGLADEEAHVGGDLLVAAAAGVELEGERADDLGELASSTKWWMSSACGFNCTIAADAEMTKPVPGMCFL